MNNDYEDLFTRPNNAFVGNGWLPRVNYIGSIVSNNLDLVSGGAIFQDNVLFANRESEFKNGEVFCEFIFLSGAVPQVYARYDETTNSGYMCFCTATQFIFAAINAGVRTDFPPVNLTVVVNTRYSFRMTLDGTNKTAVMRNEDTATDVATVTDNVNNDSPNKGVIAVSNHTGGTARYTQISATKTDDVLAATIPSSGENGTAYTFPSFVFPDHDTKAVTVIITTVPAVISGAGVLTSSNIYRDTSFDLEVTGNCVVQWVFDLYIDGVLNDTGLTATVTIGSTGATVLISQNRAIMRNIQSRIFGRVN